MLTVLISVFVGAVLGICLCDSNCCNWRGRECCKGDEGLLGNCGLRESKVPHKGWIGRPGAVNEKWQR